jgi:hypothetical protein
MVQKEVLGNQQKQRSFAINEVVTIPYLDWRIVFFGIWSKEPAGFDKIIRGGTACCSFL